MPKRHDWTVVIQQAGFPCQMLQEVVELPLINIPQFSLMSLEQLWGLSRLFLEFNTLV